MGTPSMLTRYGRAMIYAVEAQGHDLGEICRVANVDPITIAPNVDCIGADTFTRLSRAIKTQLDDEFCGFTPSRCKPGSFLLVVEAIVRDETLGDALQRAFQIYSFITTDITFSLRDDGEVATVTLSLRDPELDKFHYLHEWWLMLWPHISSWLIGEEISISHVAFPYEPSAPIEEYSEAFWTSCQFLQPITQVSFPSRFLKRRIIRRPGDFVGGYVTRNVDLVSVTGVHKSWKTLIKTKLKECLTRTERLLSIEDLAHEFNMSSKTLRRRLDEEGISFRQLKEEIRRDVVLKWLSEPDIPIGEVSLRAGFAERNGLVRAVRSWVGISPKEYRGIMAENPMWDPTGEQADYRH